MPITNIETSMISLCLLSKVEFIPFMDRFQTNQEVNVYLDKLMSENKSIFKNIWKLKCIYHLVRNVVLDMVQEIRGRQNTTMDKAVLDENLELLVEHIVNPKMYTFIIAITQYELDRIDNLMLLPNKEDITDDELRIVERCGSHLDKLRKDIDYSIETILTNKNTTGVIVKPVAFISSITNLMMDLEKGHVNPISKYDYISKYVKVGFGDIINRYDILYDLLTEFFKIKHKYAK